MGPFCEDSYLLFLHCIRHKLSDVNMRFLALCYLCCECDPLRPFTPDPLRTGSLCLLKWGTNSYKCCVLSTNGAEHKFTYRCVGWKSNCRTVAVGNQTIEGNL
ncbi:hypothetical protein M758_4G261200 [Ceratodon purpureus]|nr:hypothetical protein M758_4G261200 [Ceratodon purpureus]